MLSGSSTSHTVLLLVSKRDIEGEDFSQEKEGEGLASVDWSRNPTRRSGILKEEHGQSDTWSGGDEMPTKEARGDSPFVRRRSFAPSPKWSRTI